MLDHRKLRTPGREVLEVPTEPLALAVAGEWASQGELLQPSIMHLVSQSERERYPHTVREFSVSLHRLLCVTLSLITHTRQLVLLMWTLSSLVYTPTHSCESLNHLLPVSAIFLCWKLRVFCVLCASRECEMYRIPSATVLGVL